MKKIFLSLFVASACQLLFASNGSVYSKYGIGEISEFISGRSVGVGSSGIALLGEAFINQTNPAGLSTISRTLFAGQYQYSGNAMSDGATKSFLNSGNLLGMALAFPVYTPKGIVVALGITPYSSVGYSFKLNETRYGIQTEQAFTGSGGVTSAQISLSYNPITDLNVGLTAHYLFGAIHNDQALTYTGTTYFQSEYNQKLSLNGFAITLGGIYSGIDKALNLSSTKNVKLGVTIFSGSSLSASRQVVSGLITGKDTTTLANQSVAIPFSVTAGIAWLRNNTIFTADVRFQNWDSFKMFGVHPAELQNSLRVGTGVEFLPTKEYFESYIEQISYRIGGYVNQTNIRLKGQSINEYFISGGVGLPLGLESRFNIALEYGIRGTTTSSLVKETITRLTLSITGSEMMFIQSPIE